MVAPDSPNPARTTPAEAPRPDPGAPKELAHTDPAVPADTDQSAPAHVFVSYAHDDRGLADRLVADLEARGLVCWIDRQGLKPGTPSWEQAVRDAIRQAGAVLLIATPRSRASPYVQDELSIAALYGRTVYPVWMAGAHWPDSIALGWGGTQHVDARGDAYTPAIAALVATLRDAAPATTPAPLPPCPYPGLAAFSEGAGGGFYGRERETHEMLQCLRLHPFLAVIGPSGSGKTSLVFAGLIPALRASGLFGAGDWIVRALRPGATPLAALATALDPAMASTALDNPALAVAHHTAAAGPGAATPGQAGADPVAAAWVLLSAAPPDRCLLVVIDQWEAVFALAPDASAAFQQAVAALAATPRCYVVLTIRADFYPDLMASPLWPAIQAHRVEVTPLAGEGLREAIIRPAESVGVRVDPALLERLLTDAAGEPGALPLVQETLVLLWEHIQSRYLSLDAYEALTRSAGPAGAARRTGLQVALARRADAALAELEPPQRRIARRIFLRLVQFGEGRADTRRQQPLAALRAQGDAPGACDATVRHLVERRLLTLSGDEQGPGHQVDLAHEALIGGWPTLRAWLNEAREAEQTRRRLEGQAREWARLGQGQDGLLDAGELAEAERWLAGPDATALGYTEAVPALIAASRAALVAATRQREEARRLRAEEQARWWLVGAATTPDHAARRRVSMTALGAAALLCAACLLLSLRGAFAPIDLSWQSFALRLRHDAGLDPPRANLAIVAYDTHSAAALPVWDRASTARLIERLHAAGARLIVLDRLYEAVGTPGTAALAAAIRRAGNVVLAQRLTSESSAFDQALSLAPLDPTIARATPLVGLVNVPAHSSDGLYRAYYTQLALNGLTLPSLAQAAARAAGRRAPVSGATFLINFAGPTGMAFPTYSLAGVLDGSQSLGNLSGAIVLVGDEVATDKDLLATPVDRQSVMYGVEYNAQALNTLLENDPLAPLAPAGQIPLTLLLALLPATWALRGRLLSSMALALGLLLAFLALAMVSFVAAATWIAIAAPALSIVLAPLAALGVRVGVAERANRDTRALFRRYVAPDLVSRIAGDPAAFGLAGAARDITLLVCDIRDFSLLSAGLPPARLIALLSRYFTAMVEEIQQQGGAVDKYVGDKIMAFFGAPDPQPDAAARAVRAALAMQSRLEALNREFAATGDAPITISIALHHGPAAVGVVGPPSKREYAALGETVNTASALADAAKTLDYPIVASAAVLDALPSEARAGLGSVDLGALALQGQPTRLRLYGLDAAAGRGRPTGTLYSEAVAHGDGRPDTGALSGP